MTDPIYSAPAKIILFGEHAAVYGQPAIAAPVSALRATATVTSQPGGGLHIVAADMETTLPVDLEREDVDHALAVAARLTLKRLGCLAPDAIITVRSAIPIASGLGSGAAVTTALVRAVAGATGSLLPVDAVNEIVYEVEKIFHGTPSGIDNTVIAYEQPIWFVRGQTIERLTIAKPFTLLIADTGIQASTRVAVGDVRVLVESDGSRWQPVLNEIGAISSAAHTALQTGTITALGDLMLRNHALLRQLTVSSSELDGLVEAAVGAGAYGAKLSGGGRGGNMIVLTDDTTRAAVEAALYKAGAARVFSTRIGE